MNICCLIDSLHSGGAQRQMTWLVKALVQRGHQVRLLTYHDFDHFRPDVLAVGVEPENLTTRTKAGRLPRFRSAIREQRPDAIISFLDTPNLLGVYASLPPRRIPLVVSERNQDVAGLNWKNRTRFLAYRFADRIVTNSFAQQAFVERSFPHLAKRLRTIWNCVDLERFRPHPLPDTADGLRVVVAASAIARKNGQNLIRGVRLARDAGHSISVDWYGDNRFVDGKPTPQSGYYLESLSLIETLQLGEHFRFHPPRGDIEAVYPAYHACCLPSLQEGCPNTLCEALASGRPILVSDFGDMQRMAAEGRGFGFEPRSAESIADALIRLCRMSDAERQQMGEQGRAFAERSLSPERFATEYSQLLEEIVR